MGGVAVSSGTEKKRILCECFDARPPGFGVRVMVVTDHPTSRVPAAFLRESISRPIMTGMYL